MQIRNRISLPTGKDIRAIAGTAKCHLPLLTTLALQLGISKEDAQAMVEPVLIKGSNSFLLQRQTYSLKAWLTKLLVRDCVFKLSTAFFSPGKDYRELLQPANAIWLYNETSPLSLSARLVYVLCDVGCFDEYEVAQILNSSTARVRGELARARSIVTKPAHFLVSFKE